MGLLEANTNGQGIVPLIIVINAISIKEGGSLVVLFRLLRELVELRPDTTWHVALCKPLPELAALCPSRVRLQVFPWVERSPLHVKFWYEWKLLRFVQEVAADALFSLTNYLPHRSVSVPSLLLVQHVGHFSEVFKRLTEEQLSSLPARLMWQMKGRWVKSSVRRAQCVIVQTAALAYRIAEETGVLPERLSVIPHGPGLAVLNEDLSPPPIPGQPVRIGYITKYGVQKNFAVLFAAAARLQSLGITPVLVLTLALNTSENHAVFELARRYGVAELIENHGELPTPEINALYRSLHLFVFPSLCESFGFPMVEAMAHALPLLIADTNSNIEVAGESGADFCVGRCICPGRTDT